MILLLLLLLSSSSHPPVAYICFRPFLFQTHTHTDPDRSLCSSHGRKSAEIIIIRLKVGARRVYGFPPFHDDDESSGDLYMFSQKKTELFEPKTFENGYVHGVNGTVAHRFTSTNERINMIHLFY